MFATFCSEKDLKLYTVLKSSTIHRLIFHQKTLLRTILSAFSLVSEDEVSKIISQSTNSFSHLDSIPTSLLKQCLSALPPTWTNIINISLTSGTPFLINSNLVNLSFLVLKKYNLDKEDLYNNIDLSLIFLSYLNLLSVLLRTALIHISLQIISSTHINLVHQASFY